MSMKLYTDLLLGASTFGATATPSFIHLGQNYSSGVTRDSLKIKLYDDGGTEKYGFTVGGSGDVQYHSNTYHDFYINNALSLRINSSGISGLNFGWAIGSNAVYPNVNNINLAGDYSTGGLLLSTADGTQIAAHDARTINNPGDGYYSDEFLFYKSIDAYPTYNGIIASTGSQVKYNNAGGLLLFFDNPLGFSDYLGYRPLNCNNRAIGVTVYDSNTDPYNTVYRDTAYITAGGDIGGQELTVFDFNQNPVGGYDTGSITESHYDDSSVAFPMMTFNAHKGTSYEAGYSFQANGDGYFTISNLYGVRLMGGYGNGYTTIDTDGISTNSIKRTTAMPTSDPGDGCGTLWYDTNTNIVYRGT
jgi:hypothetical protein